MPHRNPCAACGAPWLQNRAACWACGAGADWRPMLPGLVPVRPPAVAKPVSRQVLTPQTAGLGGADRPCLRCGHPTPLAMAHCQTCGEPMLIQDPVRNNPLPAGWNVAVLPDGALRIRPPRAVAPLAAAGVLLFYLIRFGSYFAQLLATHSGAAATARAHHPATAAPTFILDGLFLVHLLVAGIAILILLAWLGLGRVEWRVEGPGLLTLGRWYFGVRRTELLRPAAVVVSPRQQPITQREGWAVQVVAGGVLHPVHWQALRSETLFYTGAFLSQQLGIPLEDHGSCDV